MLWCMCRPGSPVVHGEDGEWVATFKDMQTAQSAVAEHNAFQQSLKLQSTHVITAGKISTEEMECLLDSNKSSELTLDSTTVPNNPFGGSSGGWTKKAVWKN